MKKIFSGFIIILATIFLILNINKVEIKAQTVNNIIFHYHRFDHNYTNWDIWLWQALPTSEAGKAFAFTGEDEFGKVATIPIAAINGYNASNRPTKIGFIVKKGNWTDREPGGDRFFNLINTDETGNIHLYIISGDVNIYNDRELADISPRINTANFKDFKTIHFSTTDVVSSTNLASLVKVYKEDELVEISNALLSSNTTGVVSLKENIDLTSDYYLSLPGFNKLKYVEKMNLYDTTEFVEQFTYTGNDLGATYTEDFSEFRVWAPTATDMSLVLYTTGNYMNGSVLDDIKPDDFKAIYPMSRSDNGTWYVKINEDLHKIYYNYVITIGEKKDEVVDPYAKAVGVNGHRGMIVDLTQTNPNKWTNDKPELKEPEDSIIYELHIRDLSIFRASNITNKGKYLGLTEENTSYEGVTTGLSHLIELGITHLHLLPSFDFRSIDETSQTPAFNWGYDPLNFNTPEGTYSTDPYNGEVRINEYKQMVQALHDNGIRVVMDVVYNHLGDAGTSSFERIVPKYYFRTNEQGQYTNGSGVGNETASEREMMRKFIVDSVIYWAKEYHIDGFRFDLMAVHDIETMNQVRSALSEIDPSIIVYGEGWTGGDSALPEEQQALRFSVSKMPGIAVFNDVTRDGIKGSVWSETDKGFLQGAGRLSDVMFGIVGGVTHPQTREGWANDPEQIINYAEAHDNLTLHDKLVLSQPNSSKLLIKYQSKQAAAIVLTSQGIPFLHAGQDFLRSKPDAGEFNENSYNAPDRVNQLRWDYKADNIDVFNYYKGLITLRKAHPAFRMRNAEDIRNNLVFMDTSGLKDVIAYTINNGANGDSWNSILVAFNGSSSEQKITLPKDARYNVVVDRDQAGTDTIRTINGGELTLRANESIVAYMERDQRLMGNYLWILIPIMIGFVFLGTLFYLRKKR